MYIYINTLHIYIHTCEFNKSHHSSIAVPMGVVGAAAQTSLGDVARIGPSRTVGPGADGI